MEDGVLFYFSMWKRGLKRGISLKTWGENKKKRQRLKRVKRHINKNKKEKLKYNMPKIERFLKIDGF